MDVLEDLPIDKLKSYLEKMRAFNAQAAGVVEQKVEEDVEKAVKAVEGGIVKVEGMASGKVSRTGRYTSIQVSPSFRNWLNSQKKDWESVEMFLKRVLGVPEEKRVEAVIDK